MPFEPLDVDGLDGAELTPEPAPGDFRAPDEPAPLAGPPDEEGAPRDSL